MIITKKKEIDKKRAKATECIPSTFSFIKNKMVTITRRKKKKTYHGSNGIIGEFYQTFKELILVLHKFFKKQRRRKHFPAHSMRPVFP